MTIANDIADAKKLPTLGDLMSMGTRAASASGRINSLHMRTLAAVKAITDNADLTSEAKERRVAEIREQARKDATPDVRTLREVMTRLDEIAPLVEKPDVQHLRHVMKLEPQQLGALHAYASRMSDYMLNLSASMAREGEHEAFASVLFLEARHRQMERPGKAGLDLGQALRTLGALSDEAQESARRIQAIRADNYLSLQMGREMLGEHRVTNIDRIQSGLLKEAAHGTSQTSALSLTG